MDGADLPVGGIGEVHAKENTTEKIITARSQSIAASEQRGNSLSILLTPTGFGSIKKMLEHDPVKVAGKGSCTRMIEDNRHTFFWGFAEENLLKEHEGRLEIDWHGKFRKLECLPIALGPFDREDETVE